MTQNVASNDCIAVNNEFERTWKEEFLTRLKLLSFNWPRCTEETHGKHQSGYLVFGLRYEQGTTVNKSHKL